MRTVTMKNHPHPIYKALFCKLLSHPCTIQLAVQTVFQVDQVQERGILSFSSHYVNGIEVIPAHKTAQLSAMHN